MINAGIYKFPTSLFLGANRGEFSLENEILTSLSSKGLLKGEILGGAFFDIGVPEDYHKFCDWHRINKKHE